MNKKIILLADDDIDDTEMFYEALADINENIVFHCAVNGSEALKTLESLQDLPKLIFLDINMPVMSGWECLKFLKKDKRYQEIPVIMISTSSHKNDMEMASSLGSICYFVKPNDFNDLRQVLQAIVSNLETGLKEALMMMEAKGCGNIFAFNNL